MTGAVQRSGGQSWRRRKATSIALLVVVRLAPIGAAFGAGTWIGHATGRPVGTMAAATWLASLLVTSTVALLVTDRLLRRLLPLPWMLRMTMVVPARRSRIQIVARPDNAKTRKESRAIDAAATYAIDLLAELEQHDPGAMKHAERVRDLADLVAQELRLDRHDREMLKWSCLLHDIGKLEVDRETLSRPLDLDDKQRRALREHPVQGSKIVHDLKPLLGKWAAGIVQHHERWDGNRSPTGLAGHQISLAGRIMAVVDAFDTMTTPRPYRKPVTAELARADLVRGSGTQFDPGVVRAFMQISIGRLKAAVGPMAWLAEQPFLASAGQAGARVAASVATASAVAIGGAVASGGVPELAPPHETVATTQPASDDQVDSTGHGLIDVFIRQRMASTSSSSSTSTTSSTTSTTIEP
jgi:putative nucleotidyltransferase with HDIG domain